MSQFWACHNVCDTLGKEGEGGKGVFRLPVLNLEATLYRIWFVFVLFLFLFFMIFWLCFWGLFLVVMTSSLLSHPLIQVSC